MSGRKKSPNFVGTIYPFGVKSNYDTFLSIDVLKARTLNSYIKLTEGSALQTRFWVKNLCLINSRKIADFHKCSKSTVSYASITGYASYEVSTINGIVHRMWSLEETRRMYLIL